MQFAASSARFQTRSLQGDAYLILLAEIAIDRTDAISRLATAASLDRNRSRVAIGKSKGGPGLSSASHACSKDGFAASLWATNKAKNDILVRGRFDLAQYGETHCMPAYSRSS
jgi:hypothetical protein